MSEKKYTLNDIDALRAACRERYLYGTTARGSGSRTSRPYTESELASSVEQQVRTYMMAGITAQDIYAEDNKP
jgi:phenylacetate-coenzyme A ligase PaaK-like adenylate-forming protein